MKVKVDHEGKTVLVTGGAKRIGKALALHLAGRGNHLFIHFNGSAKRAEDLKNRIQDKGVKAWSGSADFSREQATLSFFDQAVKEAGPIDILINNASIFPMDSFDNLSEASLLDNVKINAMAPLLLAREFFKQQRPGVIINLLDACMDEFKRERVSYTLSKQMLHNITKMLAIEMAPRVRVNAVAPGLILPPEGEDESYLLERAFTNPMGAHGSLDDVCAAMDFLINSPFVTGQVIYVDGGRHLKGFDCEN